MLKFFIYCLFVTVNFDKSDTSIDVAELLEFRCNHSAWSTPGCKKIDYNLSIDQELYLMISTNCQTYNSKNKLPRMSF